MIYYGSQDVKEPGNDPVPTLPIILNVLGWLLIMLIIGLIGR